MTVRFTGGFTQNESAFNYTLTSGSSVTRQYLRNAIHNRFNFHSEHPCADTHGKDENNEDKDRLEYTNGFMQLPILDKNGKETTVWVNLNQLNWFEIVES